MVVVAHWININRNISFGDLHYKEESGDQFNFNVWKLPKLTILKSKYLKIISIKSFDLNSAVYIYSDTNHCNDTFKETVYNINQLRQSHFRARKYHCFPKFSTIINRVKSLERETISIPSEIGFRGIDILNYLGRIGSFTTI